MATDPVGVRSGRLRALIELLEKPMLLLAGLSIVLYLCELQGVWESTGLGAARVPVTLAIDLLFVVDLLLKLAVLRGPYLRSPWFLIDLVSTLPVVSTLTALPGFLASLRFIRGLRLFRVLRSLRTLRAMRLMRAMSVLELAETADTETPEGRAFDTALTVAVCGFTAVLLGILTLVGPDDQIEFWLVLGSLLGMAMVLVVVRYQVQDLASRQVRDLLNVALPPQVANHFLVHPEAYHETVRMPATVVFCDFVSFTRTVEGLQGDLDALKTHLERSMDAIVQAHIHRDLILDKFIGDAIMSFRGGNLVSGDDEEHAWRCVRAALESVDALERLADSYFHTIKIGGASSERALIGTFGTSSRLSYTILGDKVNLAARLEAACGWFKSSNLFCAHTRELTRDRDDIAWRRIGKVTIKGVSAPQDVYEALAPERVVEGWVERFEEALGLFEESRIEAAREAFRLVDAECADGPSRVYIRECERLIAEGRPEGWRPILRA